MQRRSTKEKMAIQTPMKTEQSWNGLYLAVADNPGMAYTLLLLLFTVGCCC
jgi:hypothetical protein